MFVCNPPLYQAIQLFRLLGREQYMLLCLLGDQSKYVRMQSTALPSYTVVSLIGA